MLPGAGAMNSPHHRSFTSTTIVTAVEPSSFDPACGLLRAGGVKVSDRDPRHNLAHRPAIADRRILDAVLAGANATPGPDIDALDADADLCDALHLDSLGCSPPSAMTTL